MDVPSQCTIVRAMGRSTYSSKLKHTKETTVSCIRKESSVQNPYIVRKINLYP
jgi:hypothetical protein